MNKPKSSETKEAASKSILKRSLESKMMNPRDLKFKDWPPKRKIMKKMGTTTAQRRMK